MKPSTSSRFVLKLLRVISTDTGRSIITVLFLLGLWQVNPDPDEFLIGAIPTVIGIVWAWGTGAVRESETVARVSKAISQESRVQESSQEFSAQSEDVSREKEEEVLNYLLQKGAITKRQYKYSVLAKEDKGDVES